MIKIGDPVPGDLMLAGESHSIWERPASLAGCVLAQLVQNEPLLIVHVGESEALVISSRLGLVGWVITQYMRPA